MNLRNITLEGYLRTTKGEDDKEIQLFSDTRKCRLTQNFYDLFFYNLPNGGVLGKDPSTTPSVNTGFTFDLATDASPTVNDDSDFTTKLGLTVSETIVDKYETETSLVYEVTMDATSVSSGTDDITGVAIYYTGASGDCSGITGDTMLLMKSIAPMNNEIYGASGLILSGHDVKVTFRIVIPK